MLWLPFFADGHDAKRIVSWINAQDDIAYLVRTKPNHWKAVRRVTHLPDGEHLLWHIPSGPLHPTFVPDPKAIIDDPWKGWEQPAMPHPERFLLHTKELPPGVSFKLAEEKPSVESLALVGFTLWTRHRPYSLHEMKRLKVIDTKWFWRKPNLTTSGFYGFDIKLESKEMLEKRIVTWLDREAIPLGGLTARPGQNFTQYRAFPSALKLLKTGIYHNAGGNTLYKEIREAKLP